ncbi:hypothetical protein K2173_015813 [Erythroxylum novogranatense]|uniref:protein-serine/threonine phosphatase n=1 Tax=Erythroxylum novogranatense TaxID=1862640 RepID=A0AAV8SEM5_9ROSI|nr:hypothetical protein K2173_015813 [Erythroxylum novogranatense]
MADICCGLISERGGSSECEGSSRAARRRRMEIRRFKLASGVEHPLETEDGRKRQKLEAYADSADTLSRECENAVENCALEDKEGKRLVLKVDNNNKNNANNNGLSASQAIKLSLSPSILTNSVDNKELYPKFGVASVCGRRRDMEDAVAVHPSFCVREMGTTTQLHYFGVYDGHGCSHVAMKCRERLHELVKEELENEEQLSTEWKNAMEKSFFRMDKEVVAWNEAVVGANCRCEMQSPECDAVGSAAVVAIVTPDKIIVANCGDSRAVLCRSGKAIPLSTDHKPDRPDELNRIQAAGGRVIYWDGPRVLGVLAMSRAIGDNYLKPYVSCEPEVTITDRTLEDDCLILASDGLWDVVSNDTACGVARMCLKGKGQAVARLPANELGLGETASCGVERSDRACSDASTLLTKLALARHSTDNVSVVVVDLRRDT